MPDFSMGVLIAVLLLMRVGQTLLLGGCVRSKNAAGTAVRGLLDLAIVTLALWGIGGMFLPSLLDEPAHWIYFSRLLAFDGTPPAVFLIFVIIATGAILGATAERTRLAPVLVLAALFAAFEWPLLMRAATWWYGHPSSFRALGGLATLTGGASALAVAQVVGARKGKFNRDLSINFVPGHAVVLQFVGLLTIAAAWCLANGGGLRTILGLSAAVLTGALYGRVRFGKVDTGILVTAAIGGLAASDFVAPIFGIERNWLGAGGTLAVLTGAVAGAVVPWLLITIETHFRLDDAAGLSSAYLGGGTVGLLLAALFRRPPSFKAYINGWWHDVVFWLVAVGISTVVAYAIAKLFASKNALRVSESVEYDGVDLAEFDVNAYPDFQQTMIKSHHLRQL